MSALLELQQVARIYPSGEHVVRALDGVTVSIAQGEFVAIMGQSGSGKSTLMNILGCLDRPSSGQYRIDGVDVARLDADQLAALRRDTFGFIFQRYNLLADATAAENVEIPAIYAGRSRAQRHQRAQQLLEQLGLGERVAHKPNQLSGGQQQRVSIARALMNDAPVILADEPTGALDSRSGEEVLQLLKTLHQQGRTILLITHDAKVAAHAQRVIEIRDGQIVRDSGAVANPHPQALALQHARHPGFIPDLLEAVKMAWRSLRSNGFRTALTLLGVVIGVAAVVTLLAIGDGSKLKVVENIQKMGTNLLIVMPGAPGVRPSGDIATLVASDAEAIAQLPGIEGVLPERSTTTTVRYSNQDYRTTVQGSWPQYPQVRDWAIAQGGFFTQADVLGYAPVAVLGQTVVTNLFGNDNPIGRYVLMNNIPFEVVGVLERKGASAMGSDMDDTVLVPLSTGFMRLFGKQYLRAITVRVRDTDQIEALQQQIEELLTARHRTEDFQIRNTASLLEAVSATQDTLTILLGSVAAISLLVGGIGVMNIMLVSVTERTREIGVRMATGARMANILLQFNTEALVVCGIGGLIGVGLGLGCAALVEQFGMRVVYSLGPPLLAFGCAFITGLVFGYLPARKAAQLDPVIALSSE